MPTLHRLVVLLLASLPACAGSDPATTEGGTSSGGESSTTGDEGPPLGERASQACHDATALWPALRAAAPADAATLYSGSALQSYVQASDALGERGDDPAIVAALAEGSPDGLAHAAARAQASMIGRLRLELAGPEALVDDPHAAWDEAHCLWVGSIRGLMVEAEAAAAPGDPGLVDRIDAAFVDGHAGIVGAPTMASIDEWILPANKQRIEKSLFRGLHRLVLADAALAGAGDPAAARRAAGRFAAFADRLEGRNTPGIAIIEGMLADPATVDVAVITRELAIAFAKRTRKYCSDALDSDALGTPSGYAGAVEGRTYQDLILPDMTAALAAQGFAADGYLDTWDAWVEAVRGGDAAAAIGASEALVSWNCAYQASLGIASCTSSMDEPE